MGPYEATLKEMRKQMLRNNPMASMDAEFLKRRTGRTTGEVLFILWNAMREPGTTFRVKNHPTGGKFATMEMNIIAFGMMRDIIRELGLEFFTLDRYELTVTYNPPGRENM